MSSRSSSEPDAGARPAARKGRGAASNRAGRYEAWDREEIDDGWGAGDEPPPKLRTEVQADSSRSIIARNHSPDIPFDRSINPYRGCEHGCTYCYARPSHAWLGLSPGLDFESRIFFKPAAASLLRAELARPGYRCAPIALGSNTDPYQPVERRLKITRGILEVLDAHHHPATVVTKGALVERDLDLLQRMARRRLVAVFVSVTTLDRELARRMEPRAAAPERRLRTIEHLDAAGIPVGVLVAPVIPALNDAEIERILERTRGAGACSAHYVLLRLPLEIKDLFAEWLESSYPLKAARVMARVRDTREGKAYQSGFGVRMRGTGEYATLIARRFDVAHRRLGFGPDPVLDTAAFTPPQVEPPTKPDVASGQLSLL